jgi:hypothetical protein
LTKISGKFSHENLVPNNYNYFESFGWKKPNSPYHITSMFVNRKKESMDKDEFKNFKEDVDEQIAIKGIVIIENYLMAAFCFPTCVPIENQVPHITLMLKEAKAFDSNITLEKLLTVK